jgi:dTMP kinase
MSVFITLEGPSGIGKSTIIEMMKEQIGALEGVNEVRTYRDPGGDPVSEELRKIAKNPPGPIESRCAMFTFLAARINLQARIQEFMRENPNNVAICDRWSDSTRIYQRLFENIPITDIESALNLAHLKDPDMTVVLYMPLKNLLERRNSRIDDETDRYEASDFLKTEVAAYKSLARDMVVWENEGLINYDEDPLKRLKYIENSGAPAVAMEKIMKNVYTLLSEQEEFSK